MSPDLLDREWAGTTAHLEQPTAKTVRLASSGLVVLWALAPSGTTSGTYPEDDSLLAIYAPGQTDSGLVGDSAGTTSSTANDLATLRRRTGLPWSQLAQLFGVGRRSLHNWILGSTMSQKNAETLRSLLRATRALAQNLASNNKYLLQSADRRGVSILDHLAAGRFGEAEELIKAASSTARAYKRPPQLSATERMKRRGPSVRERLQIPEVNSDSGSS